MPILAPLLAGAASGTAGGLFGMFGNKNQGPKDQDILDPMNLVNFLMSMLNAGQQKKAWQSANLANEQRYGQALDVARAGGENQQGLYNEGAQQQLSALLDVINQQNRSGAGMDRSYRNRYDQFLSGFDDRAGGITEGYENRYRRAEQDIEGYGNQMKADIDEAAANKQGELTQKNIGTGLFSSTVQNAQNLAIDRDRSAEQRRLGEDLTRSRVNLLSGLSGDTLGAQERLNQSRGAFDAALSGDYLGYQERRNANQASLGQALSNLYGTQGANRANMFGGSIDDLLNIIIGRSDVGPPPNALPYQFGQNSGGSMQAPGWGSSFLAGAAPGFGQGVGAAITNAFAPQQVPQYNGPMGYSPYVNTSYDSSWMTGGFDPSQYPGGWGPPSY